MGFLWTKGKMLSSESCCSSVVNKQDRLGWFGCDELERKDNADWLVTVCWWNWMDIWGTLGGWCQERYARYWLPRGCKPRFTWENTVEKISASVTNVFNSKNVRNFLAMLYSFILIIIYIILFLWMNKKNCIECLQSLISGLLLSNSLRNISTVIHNSEVIVYTVIHNS